MEYLNTRTNLDLTLGFNDLLHYYTTFLFKMSVLYMAENFIQLKICNINEEVVE
jgi:hypothetical protein